MGTDESELSLEVLIKMCKEKAQRGNVIQSHAFFLLMNKLEFWEMIETIAKKGA